MDGATELRVRPAVAWRPLVSIGAAVAAVLLAFAGRYGYHRDELYFLRAGRGLALGYVDQPPLTPLVARAMDTLAPGSLVALRLPSALVAGLVVLLAGLLAREFDTGRGGQVFAAGCMAVSSVLLFVGHLLSTTTLDLLAWTALSWLLVRALRDGGPVWLPAGAVAGIALENKVQPAFLVAAVVLGLLAVGPREALRSPWPWLGGLIALAVWAPNLAWQAANGWPQLELAEAIAAGSSGTSEPWYLFVPFQLVLVSPVLVPVWVAGLWRLARDPGAVHLAVLRRRLRPARGALPRHRRQAVLPRRSLSGAAGCGCCPGPRVGPARTRPAARRAARRRDGVEPGDQRSARAARRPGGSAGGHPDHRRQLRRRGDRRLAGV